MSTEGWHLLRRRQWLRSCPDTLQQWFQYVDEVLLKRQLFNVLKVLASLGILTYLIVSTFHKHPESLHQLQSEPKNWSLLIAAWVLLSVALMITFFRWYLLVRVLSLPFSLRDAFRLGFVGYFFNLISIGAVGGDLFKAIFLAREQPGRRTEAVATVIVDRLVGLYGLLLIASVAIAFSKVSQFSDHVRLLCQGTLIVTAVASVALLMLVMGFGINGKLANQLCRVRRIGPFFERLIFAAQTYRKHISVLGQALLLTLCVHAIGAVAFFFIASSLPGETPSLATHFFIIPLGMVAGVIPLPMGALGAIEGVMQFLYDQTGGNVAKGLVVTLVYRLITILIAMVGVGFYVRTQRDLNRVLKEARQLGGAYD